MGTQKLVLPFGKSTIIETVVDNVLQSSVDHVMIVLGANQHEIRELLKNQAVEFCYNQDHNKGMLSSVKCGIRSLPPGADAALIYLGDQPKIPSFVTDAVIKAYSEDLYGIVIPVYNHRRGHPLLVDMKYRREIEQLNLEEGLRKLRHHFPEDVLEVEVDAPGILVDIDTREDYQKARD
jgi:CTP:molybdopterin cytidylyltransferase MocA